MTRTPLHQLVGAGLAAMALSVSAVALATPAGAADRDAATATTGRHSHRLHLTDQQKQCMKDQGITRPIRPLTPEKITAIKTAAKACNITLGRRLAGPTG